MRILIFCIIILLQSCQVGRKTRSNTYYSSHLNQTLSIAESVLVPGEINRPMREVILKENFIHKDSALDIGTGSGILSYLLASKGFKQIISTDINPNAIRTVQENSKKLGFEAIIQPRLVNKENSPYSTMENKVDLIISNPPWFDEKPTNMKDAAFYDEKLQLLNQIIDGLKNHLNPKGFAYIELGGEEAIKTCEAKLKTNKLAYTIVIDSTYGHFSRPYRIYKIRL